MAKKRHSIRFLAAIFLASILSYRIGLMAGCASSWLPDARSMTGHGNDNAPDLSYPASSRGISSSLQQEHQQHEQQQEQLPYQCGIVFFYHIPSTGGASINTWLKKYSSPKKYNYTYFQHWKSDFTKGAAKDPIEALWSEANFTMGMNAHVRNLGPKEWRIAHCHINSMHMNETEELLYRWRSTVEEQGCHMVNTVMLRDPLSHTMSLHKVIKRKKSTWEEWTQYLHEPTARGLWATNLDFILYNKARRNPHHATKEQKVQRAMELLQRHFNVVTVGDHATFMKRVLELTGWEEIDMPYTNTFKGELTFTKKEVENLQKLLSANGDTEFMDAVKRRYNGYLSYLE